MSFAATVPQVKRKTKTVTRRNGWTFLKEDDFLWAVEKAQGLKKGECVKRLALIRVVSVRRERLDSVTIEDVWREGFPGGTRQDFIELYCRINNAKPSTIVTRIEFAYVPLDPRKVEGGEL